METIRERATTDAIIMIMTTSKVQVIPIKKKKFNKIINIRMIYLLDKYYYSIYISEKLKENSIEKIKVLKEFAFVIYFDG